MLSPNPRKRPHTARAISLAFDEIKNIATTKKSAASQMVSGFNPLNAGQDKSEARRLLGIKKPKKKQDAVPFFQRIWFQIAALMLIVAMTVYLLIPKSAGQIITEAKEMIESNDSEKWSEARFELQPIMDRGGRFADEAKELYYTSRRQSLVLNAENGMSNRLQNENVQLFGKAVRLQQDGQNAEAREILTQLVVSVDPDGSDRHVFAESKFRLAALVIKEDLPTDVAELSDLIAKARDASTSGQLLEAHDLLARIAYEYTGVENYDAVVATASDQLIAIKKRIASGEEAVVEKEETSGGDETQD